MDVDLVVVQEATPTIVVSPQADAQVVEVNIGQAGAPGVGFPAGGTTGQYLIKLSDAPYDVGFGLAPDGSTGAAVTTVNGRAGEITLTKTDVGLGNVNNTSDAAKPLSTAAADALALKANANNPTFTGTITGINATAVGLGNVNNTSDLAKPVSTATGAALALKANIASPTFTGTVSVSALRVGTSATPGQILTSDASGNASWGTYSASNIADLQSTVQTYVNQQLDIAGAPGTLDTINELAAALGDDPNFATTLTNSLAAKAPINNPTFTGTVGGITASMVGLGNVSNIADASKTFSATQINSGVLNIAQVPVGTGAGQVAPGIHNHDASQILTGVISPARLGGGTASSATYLRGDGTWATVTGGTGGSSTLAGLTDVQISSAAVGEILRHDGVRWTDYLLTKGDIGLNLVDNTPDSLKPLSTPQVAAIDSMIDSSEQISRNRQNHTGVQGSDTISDFEPAVKAIVAAMLSTGGGGGGSTPPVEDPLINAPTNVVAAPGNTEINVTWEPPTSTGTHGAVVGYIVSRNNPTYSTSVLASTTRSFLLTNFANGTPYTVGVAATFADGFTSPPRNVVNVVPQAAGGTGGGGTGTITKVMLMGDDNTAVDATTLGYKGVMLDQLIALGYNIDYVGSQTSTGPVELKDFQHEGHTGWQNSNFITTAAGFVTTYTPDVVVYFMGTNDLWSNVTPAVAVDRVYQTLSPIFAARPSVKVVVVKIPLMGVAQESVRVTYNGAINNVYTDYTAEGRNIRIADLSNTLVGSDLQADGIHWTAGGHTKIATALTPVVKAAIDGAATGGTGGNTGGTGGTTSSAPMPYPAHPISVYHMMWSNSGSPPLANTNANTNVLKLAFAQTGYPTLTGPASEGTMANLSARLKELRARGVRIVISVGGGGYTQPTSDRASFVAGIMNISNNICPVDGLDWDVEVGTSAPNTADVLAICQSLRQQRGANFAVTFAPNGNTVNAYIGLAQAVNNAGMLSAFGQQFYDTVVSESAMMGRLSQYVSAGLPISKYEIGMMMPRPGDNQANYWDLPTCISRLNKAKSTYPALGGAYLWEAGRPGAQDWATSVGNIIKSW